MNRRELRSAPSLTLWPIQLAKVARGEQHALYGTAAREVGGILGSGSGEDGPTMPPNEGNHKLVGFASLLPSSFDLRT